MAFTHQIMRRSSQIPGDKYSVGIGKKLIWCDGGQYYRVSTDGGKYYTSPHNMTSAPMIWEGDVYVCLPYASYNVYCIDLPDVEIIVGK